MEMKKVLNTEVGLLAIWDSASLSRVSSLEDYRKIFVSNVSMIELMKKGEAVVWGTGGDGAMAVTVRVNPDHDLEPDEEKLVEMEAKDYKLVVTSDLVTIGSPECVGTVEEKCLKNKLAFPVEGLEKGQYLVSVYFLYDSRFDTGELDSEDANQDMTGYLVVLKKVDADYDFPPIEEFPELG